jgi:hypothetical protein
VVYYRKYGRNFLAEFFSLDVALADLVMNPVLLETPISAQQYQYNNN